MKKILIIDNGTRYLKSLQNLAGDNITLSYDRFENITEANFKAVILSGGHDFPVVNNHHKLAKEINFVKTTLLPVFGVCFGFEIIAAAFGGKLERLTAKEKGILKIKIIGDDPVFKGIKHIRVFENHRWVVTKNGEDLFELGVSKDGIEAVKHKTKMIYGVQFHPEMFINRTHGDRIFRNFLQLIP